MQIYYLEYTCYAREVIEWADVEVVCLGVLRNEIKVVEEIKLNILTLIKIISVAERKLLFEFLIFSGNIC